MTQVERYTVFDTDDQIWFGDLNGPTVYPDYDLAYLAAITIAEMHNYPIGRVEVQSFNHTGTKLRDEIKADIGPWDALQRIEQGRTLAAVRYDHSRGSLKGES